MDIRNVKTASRPRGPALRWGLAVLGAVCAGLGLSYVWRVLFYLDERLAPAFVTLGCIGLALLFVGAAALVRFACRGFAAKGAACIFLCGLLFVFANAPLQTPDETDHYLRTYAISLGRLDFDAGRGYPQDVSALLTAFPGAWVNAHTSVGVGTDPVTGGEQTYDTAGYALKRWGDGPIQSVADSFAAYFGGESTEPVREPLSFLILPFVPGAVGMALARLLGLGALGCLYGGRIGNLLAYTLLCRLALQKAHRARPLLLGFMLLPLSLYMAASLSYDATLLGGYYLMLALLTRRHWNTAAAAQYAAACVWVNVAKPYLNLLWVLLPLLVAAPDWQAKGRRRHWCLGMLAGALAAAGLVEWYGRAFRHGYPAVIERQGGAAVDGAAQLGFILRNPLRYLAVVLGTLYENDGFLGQLGLFGWKDLPVPLLSLTGPLVLAAGVLFSAGAGQSLGRRRSAGLGVFAAVYALGAMTAMYITYTPVGMVRIVGLQARYFLPVFLALGFGAAAALRRAAWPDLAAERAQRLALPIFGGYAALAAVLLFQHYFIGPFYTVPV